MPAVAGSERKNQSPVTRVIRRLSSEGTGYGPVRAAERRAASPDRGMDSWEFDDPGEADDGLFAEGIPSDDPFAGEDEDSSDGGNWDDSDDVRSADAHATRLHRAH